MPNLTVQQQRDVLNALDSFVMAYAVNNSITSYEDYVSKLSKISAGLKAKLKSGEQVDSSQFIVSIMEIDAPAKDKPFQKLVQQLVGIVSGVSSYTDINNRFAKNAAPASQFDQKKTEKEAFKDLLPATTLLAHDKAAHIRKNHHRAEFQAALKLKLENDADYLFDIAKDHALAAMLLTDTTWTSHLFKPQQLARLLCIHFDPASKSFANINLKERIDNFLKLCRDDCSSLEKLMKIEAAEIILDAKGGFKTLLKQQQSNQDPKPQAKASASQSAQPGKPNSDLLPPSNLALHKQAEFIWERRYNETFMNALRLRLNSNPDYLFNIALDWQASQKFSESTTISILFKPEQLAKLLCNHLGNIQNNYANLKSGIDNWLRNCGDFSSLEKLIKHEGAATILDAKGGFRALLKKPQSNQEPKPEPQPQAKASAAEPLPTFGKARSDEEAAKKTAEKIAKSGRDLYNELEVNADATSDRIKQKYRELALKYTRTNPDPEKMKTLNEAKDVLMNDKARKAYDEARATNQNIPRAKR